MIVNNERNHLVRLRKILEEQHGIIQTARLAQFNIPRTYLAILERNGEIERVSRGVYRATNALEDELYAFQSVYKSSVYSHETALYLHDLTDRSPLYYSITVPSGYHSMALNNSQNKVFYVKRGLSSLGVESMKSPHGNEIRVTGLDRTICDILRSRNQMDIQLVNDALKRYVKSPKKNLDLLYQCARQFGVQKIAQAYIAILL